MEEIINLDKQLLIYLNNLGSESFDGFWLFITKQFNLIPLFLWVFYLLIKKIGWKQFGYVVIALALLITFTDQMTNLVKYSFERMRPCSDPTVKNHIRIIIERSSYSFFSGHAANSMATTIFIYSILRRYYKYTILLFLFPLIFAYSRIYLGLHFPGDILTGYVFGALFGWTFYKLYLLLQKKYFPIQ